MNREAVVRAAFFMCKALGRPTSRREINAIIVAVIGKGYRWSAIDAALYDWGPRGDQTGTTNHAQNGKTGTIVGTKPDLLKGIELEFNSVDSLRSSTCIANGAQAESAPPPPPKRRPPQARLLLFGDRDAILDALWPCVQPYIGRTTGVTAWKKRNSLVAQDLAAHGWTPEKIVKAWELASAKSGEPIRELMLLQKHMDRMGTHYAMNGKGRA